jgi:1,4-alpha-glucan branching enzyme
MAAGFPGDWDPATTLMTTTGNNIYSVTVNIPNGTYQYKFINGNAWGNDEPSAGTCFSGGNRSVTITGNTAIPTVLFGQCPVVATTYSVTFKVDMATQTVGANGVHVAGNFQGWDPAATALTNTSGTIWEVTVPNLSGSIQYKFINGNSWSAPSTNESIPGSCNVSGNRGATITANTTLPLVCYGQCGACPAATYSVTFKVDMANQTVGPNGVRIAGSFQGWDPAATPLTNTSGTIWQVTVPNIAGGIAYKFINGNAWGNDEPSAAACFTSGDRTATITANTTLPTVCYGECAPCAQPVTFQVDMTGKTVGATGMFVAGSFQGWNATATPMTNMGNGIWKVSVPNITPGPISYKFINGTNWETILGTCTTNGDRTATVAAGTVLPIVCYEQCAACPTVTYSVTFQVDMTGKTVSPNGVYVAGSFQGWQAGTTPLTNQGNGIWATTVNGIAGAIEYKFINGNTWGNDEIGLSAPCSTNGNRSANITANTTFPLVCFGLCTACPVITYSATFSVDMTGKTVSPAGVHLAGNFQGWSPSATLMTNMGNGIWKTTVTGLAGPIEYKFINGDAWGPNIDESVASGCANANGNRSATITAATTMPVVCFEQCLGCALNLTLNNNKKITCYGKSDGELTVTYTGGSGCTPTFTWSNGQIGATATNLKSDVYKVTATCGALSSITTTIVREPAEVRFLTQSSVNISCAGTGQAIVTASGGTGNLSFLWSNGATTATAAVTTAGTYSVTATDENGCSLSNSVNVGVDQGVPVANIANITPTLDCKTTSIVLDASGSTGGGTLSYKWSGGGITAGASTNKATINKAGTYTIAVTSSNGCSSSKSIVVTEDLALPLAKIEGDSIICAADTTTLSVSSASTYLWSNGAATQSIKTNKVGAYSVVVTGANGCSTTALKNVLSAPQPIVTIKADTLTCIKKSIQLNATAGSNIVTTKWSGPSSYVADSLKAVVTKAGVYNLTAKTNEGCVATFSTTIAENITPVTLAITAGNKKLCAGDSTTLVATSNGASYLWNNGATTSSIKVKENGQYSVKATGSNSCFKSDTVKIAVSPKMTVSIAGKPDCNNAASIFATVNGGTPNYNYAWSVSTTNGNPIFVTAPASVQVTVTDDFGCKVSTTPLVLTANTAISVTATIKDELKTDGSIDITVSGGAAPFSYVWATGATTKKIEGLTAGKYCVTITDKNKCTKTECFDVKKINGTIDNVLAQTLKVFPNPIEDVLNIDIQGNTELTNIELLDITGRVIAQYDGAVRQISTAHLPAAIYTLKCSTKQGYAMKKVVK